VYLCDQLYFGAFQTQRRGVQSDAPPTARTLCLPERDSFMSTTTPRTVVHARIQSHHVDQLRQLAVERDTTVSRLIARAVADQLNNAEKRDPAR
jgi:hypothetical protein